MWSILEGDCRTVLASLEAGSVQTCVTSPPYFGLRDYGEDGQIGLEPTPDEFVAALVGVFREVRRVLRDDGTVWLNLGDSYNSTPPGNKSPMSKSGLNGAQTSAKYRERLENTQQRQQEGRSLVAGYKPKDLLGIPWMVAFALRADGWYLRSDIIWSKPNPMPESVTDRPTKAHEQVFLLAKGGKWKARVVPLANLPAERIHLGQDLRAQGPNLVAGDFGVRLATAILDRTEGKDSLGLPSLDPQVREQGDAHHRGSLVGRLPVEHWAPVLAARLLRSDVAPKEFLSELYGRGIALANRDKFLIGGIEAEFALPPGVDRYGETSIAIHHPGEIREFDLVHGRIIVSTAPTSCSYFYDADAIREEGVEPDRQRSDRIGGSNGHTVRHSEGAVMGASTSRNKRSVWTVATQPYPGAHFATFPPKLVEPCILAGCPERACGVCGAPWQRVMERRRGDRTAEMVPGRMALGHNSTPRPRSSHPPGWRDMQPDEQATVGWEPSCAHHDDTGSSVVLDPFAGAGTTGMVALRHNRSFIGIELSPAYAELARRRIVDDAPLLNSVLERSADPGGTITQ